MANYARISAAYPRSLILPPVRRAVDAPDILAQESLLIAGVLSAYAGRTYDVLSIAIANAVSPGDDLDVVANLVPTSQLIDAVLDAHFNASGWAPQTPQLTALIAANGYT